MPGKSTRALLLATLALAFAMVPSTPARAEKQDARKHYDHATAAFGLGRYAEAATEYEAAFGLRPEPALLYNCAQSYRLAGNKPRALELYRNYLRLFGDASNADDARKHVNDLELEVVAERAVSPNASTAMDPTGVAPRTSALTAAPGSAYPSSSASPSATGAPGSRLPAGPGAPGTVAMASSSTAATGLGVAAPPPDVHVDVPAPVNGGAGDSGQTPLLRRPWFWVAVGAVVVGGTVGVLLATRGEKDPAATIGMVAGN